MNAQLKEQPWVSNGPTKVYQAIAAITGELAKVGIAKGRENKQQGYAFRGIDDVYAALSTLLASHKLCVIPRVINRTVTEQESRSGGKLFYTVLDVEYDMVSAEDGSRHTARAVGEAMDSGDKSSNKAMSAAYKYFALQTFCIPTQGDNDTENHTHEVAAIAKITAEQRVELDKLLAQVGSDAKKLCAHLKIASLTDIQATEFQSVRKLVESKRRHA